MPLFSKDNKKEEVKKSDAGKDMKAKKADKTKKEETKSGSKKTVKQNKNIQYAYRVLIRPLITEKGAKMADTGKYLFEVAMDANKIEIAKAIEELYDVYPKSVNIIKMKGKVKRYGRYTGKRKDWKKAIVTLPKGKTINIYEGV